MQIIDIDDGVSTQQFSEPRPVLSKGELHVDAQKHLLQIAKDYKYEIGFSESLEKLVWTRVDKILKATTQKAAEEAAFDAIYWGSQDIAFWRRRTGSEEPKHRPERPSRR